MNRRVTSTLGTLVLFGLAAAVAGAQPRARGTLVVVGGGLIGSEITTRAATLAGGTAAVVAILPQASELADTGEVNAKMWREAGAGRTIVVDLKAAEAAIRALSEASFIWMPGGDQTRLVAALRGAGLVDLIRRRYAEGAVVGGTSAGAAVISKVMITGDADLQSITAGRTKTKEGLGLWPEVVVDQHFLKRQREARLISLVLDRPDLVGVGLDESTAVFVTGGRFEVVGRSSVLVVDARRATVGRVQPGALSSAHDVTLHVLTPGMTFALVR